MQFEDIKAAQLANPPKYDERGLVVQGTGTLPVLTGTNAQNLDQGYQPLPQVNSQAPVVDPVTKFNQGILDLLKRAQSVDTTALYNEQNRLAVGQTANSMAPASQLGVEGLKPGDALAARQNAGQLMNPEINNLTQRIQASNQAVANFKDALTAAKEYSAEYAKSIKPDEQTIKAVQDMLIAGQNPGTDVLDSVYKYIDWTAVAAGKKKTSDQPSSYKEYALTTDKPTPAGYAQFLKTGTKSGDGTSTTFAFTVEDKKRLLGVGLASTEIDAIQTNLKNGISIDTVLGASSLSDAEKKAVKDIMLNTTPTQMNQNTQQFLSPQWFWQNYTREQLMDFAKKDGLLKTVGGGLLGSGLGASKEPDPDAYISAMMTKINRDRSAGMSDPDIYQKYFKQ